MRKAITPPRVHLWTALKLEYLDHYLQAYVRATKKAREIHYIDTFAGCGKCIVIETGLTIDGSAWRALNARPNFTQYHFIEQKPSFALYLRQQIFDKGIQNATVYTGDCNLVIPTQVLPKIPPNVPCFAFIDPYGLAINWETIRAIASHRLGWKIELLILYPYDMAISRCFALLNRPGYKETLTRYYEDDSWMKELEESVNLGETTEQKRRRFVQLYSYKLKSLGYKFVASYGPLTSKGRPLYYVIFASDHPIGHKIMNAVWGKPRLVPGQLGFEPVKR